MLSICPGELTYLCACVYVYTWAHMHLGWLELRHLRCKCAFVSILVSWCHFLSPSPRETLPLFPLFFVLKVSPGWSQKTQFCQLHDAGAPTPEPDLHGSRYSTASSENSGFAMNSTVAGSAQFSGKFLSTCKETSSLLIGPSIQLSPSGSSTPRPAMEAVRGR